MKTGNERSLLTTKRLPWPIFLFLLLDGYLRSFPGLYGTSYPFVKKTLTGHTHSLIERTELRRRKDERMRRKKDAQKVHARRLASSVARSHSGTARGSL